MRTTSSLVAATLGTAIAVASPAQAQELPGTLFAFGDSLLDVRRTCTGYNIVNGGAGTCSNGTGQVEWLSRLTGFGFDKANDYAVGGSGTGPFPLGAGPNVDGQILEFKNAGGHIQPNDLVLLSGLSNNNFLLANPAFTPEGLASAILQQQQANVGSLIDLGARNIVAYGGSTNNQGLNFYQIGGVLSTQQPLPTPPGADVFFKTVDAGLPGILTQFAAPGTRIRIFDFRSVYERAYLHPADYGFTAPPGTGGCVLDPACLTASKDVQNQRFLYDVHPTEAGQLVLARYVANLIASADGIPAQAEAAQIAANSFSSSLFQRLDAYRAFGPAASGAGMPDPSYLTKAPSQAAAPAQSFSVFMEGTYIAGERSDRIGPAGAALGFTYDIEGVTAGFDYRINRNVRFGAAVNYAQPHVDLNTSNGGDIDITALQLGGYASFTSNNWWTDLVATWSTNNYEIERAGVAIGDVIKGRTDGDAFTAALKSVYLFNTGPIQVGPLVGLNYTRVAVDGYTETGDPVLTQIVKDQTLESLVGSAGVQFRFPFLVGRNAVSPYLNVTAEHEFLDTGRTIVTANTFAAGLPIFSVVPGVDNETYGQVAAGVSASLDNGISVNLNGLATFGREGGNDHAVTGGLKISF